MVSTSKILLFTGVFFILLTFLDTDIDGVRFRGSRARYGSTRARVRVRQRVGTPYSSRVGSTRVRVRNRYSSGIRYRRGGSLPYATFGVFAAAGVAGSIYGYSHYHRSTRYRADWVPPICTNHHERIPGTSRTYGNFICPLMDEPDHYLYCCGQNNRERCCSAEMFRNQNWSGGGSTSPWAIVGVIIVLILIIVIIVLCCRRHRQRQQQAVVIVTKSGGDDHDSIKLPLNSAGNDEMNQMAAGPPPYQPPAQYPPPAAYPPPAGPYPPPAAGYPDPNAGYPPQPAAGYYPPPAGQYPPPAAPYPPGPPMPAEPGFKYPPPGPDASAPPPAGYPGGPPPAMTAAYGAPAYGAPGGYPPQ